MTQTLTLYQVDAFADKVFQGNPAAVISLETWLNDELLQAIAAENNLSETAFFVQSQRLNTFHLRWFTPVHEAPLCGHATLATAYVIFHHIHPRLDNVYFHTQSGSLSVHKQDNVLTLDFPRYALQPCEAPKALLEGLEHKPQHVFKTVEDTNYYAIYSSETEVRELKPNLEKLASLFPYGVVVTAAGDTCDFVSRYFAPGAGIPEDPVTGSTHCGLIPYWAEKLNKTQLLAKQLSKRGGTLHCELLGDRVAIGGQAVQYLVGEITI
ncbi:MAG: PhzF family phenazine biosynthesis protein [Deinococcota bacterium]